MIRNFFILFVFRKSLVSRISPYPPNFRSIAARIMDPAIGASTCALGSQR